MSETYEEYLRTLTATQLVNELMSGADDHRRMLEELLQRAYHYDAVDAYQAAAMTRRKKGIAPTELIEDDDLDGSEPTK